MDGFQQLYIWPLIDFLAKSNVCDMDFSLQTADTTKE